MDSNMFTPIDQTIQQKYDGLYPGLLDIIASFYNSHLSGFYMQSLPLTCWAAAVPVQLHKQSVLLKNHTHITHARTDPVEWQWLTRPFWFYYHRQLADVFYFIATLYSRGPLNLVIRFLFHSQYPLENRYHFLQFNGGATGVYRSHFAHREWARRHGLPPSGLLAGGRAPHRLF